jgi:glutamate/tyrosine decarboxylase-like PLP-dependent enzyme
MLLATLDVALSRRAVGAVSTMEGNVMELSKVLADRVTEHARSYLGSVAGRPVRATLSGDDLRALLGGPLPDRGEDPVAVIDALAEAGRAGTVASQGPRYFGFVTGGSIPAAIAADWLVSAWDQNAQMFVMSPVAAVVEQVVSGWLKELVGLPQTWSVGFVTGAQMANFTSLLAARHSLLLRAGWDVESRGLFDAPPIAVVVSEESHRTIFTALSMLGLGATRVRRVATDAQGRMRPVLLAQALKSTSGPCIVCAQIGNVNTGAADPVDEIAALARERGAWLHIDAAFGLWAAATSSRRSLVTGIERADSIATDGHKWLVPYDCGVAFTAHPDAHTQSLVMPAHYIQMTPGEREPRSFTPDESRRARGLPLYAALRALGRTGVRDLVERCCLMAERMAAHLSQHQCIRILNDVVLNQVLVQCRLPGSDDAVAAELTQKVIGLVQEDGTCWVGGTKWQGQVAMRISVANWSTTAEDIDRSAAAILAAVDTLTSRSQVTQDSSGRPLDASAGG